MAKQNYEECLNRLLKDEGGYSNHPSDKGGPTNYGITITDYRRYVKPTATVTDVKNMKLSEAKAIYRKRYWDAIDGDNLPSGIDYCVFDYGVNSGVSRAEKIYSKFKHIEDPVAMINAICDERLAFMKRIRGGSDWKVFGRGWSNRVAGVRARSIQLATAKPSAGAGTGATIAAGGLLSAINFPQYALYIIAGTIIVGIAAYFLVRRYKQKTMKNVQQTI